MIYKSNYGEYSKVEIANNGVVNRFHYKDSKEKAEKETRVINIYNSIEELEEAGWTLCIDEPKTLETMESKSCEHLFKECITDVSMRGTYDPKKILTQQRVIIYCQKCGVVTFDSVRNDTGDVISSTK